MLKLKQMHKHKQKLRQ